MPVSEASTGRCGCVSLLYDAAAAAVAAASSMHKWADTLGIVNGQRRKGCPGGGGAQHGCF